MAKCHFFVDNSYISACVIPVLCIRGYRRETKLETYLFVYQGINYNK